jgi:hypothetical protein
VPEATPAQTSSTSLCLRFSYTTFSHRYLKAIAVVANKFNRISDMRISSTVIMVAAMDQR